MFQESIESDIQYDCGVIGSAAILLVSALMFYSTRLVPLLIQFVSKLISFKLEFVLFFSVLSRFCDLDLAKITQNS